VVDQAETPLHEIQLEMNEKFPDIDFEFILADITNKKRLESIFTKFNFDLVYHAAAYKHVPMIENNPHEAVWVNILGTKNLAKLSVQNKVKTFVMVSTDKAVNPTNVMGASKRSAELLVQSLQFLPENKTKFITTRFGNVLGLLLLLSVVSAAWAQERQDTIVVSRDGTGNFRTLQEAIESARAFMDYTVTIYVKNGVYKEKVIVPSWVENIDIIGEDRDKTIITYDDHANINKMGTFRTYTVKVEGSDITFKNLTIENNAAQLGQAVALHTEGDRLKFINCRILGNQDTIYTGAKFTRLYFKDCYIDGTTDFIFGPSTALFEDCIIHSKRNSYVTAASTPKEAKYGYVFKHCKLTAEPGVDKVYLGRPWRPYAYTLFIECELGKHIVLAGWHNWGKQSNEETARYMEYKNTGEGANASERVAWSKQLTKKEAEEVTVDAIFRTQSDWNPID
jgi:pectinesterase